MLEFFFEQFNTYHNLIILSGWVYGEQKPEMLPPVINNVQGIGQIWKELPSQPHLEPLGRVSTGFELQLLVAEPVKLKDTSVSFAFKNFHPQLWRYEDIFERIKETDSEILYEQDIIQKVC